MCSLICFLSECRPFTQKPPLNHLPAIKHSERHACTQTPATCSPIGGSKQKHEKSIMHASVSQNNVCVNSIDCCPWTTAAEGTMLLTSIHQGIINEMIWLMKQTLLLTRETNSSSLTAVRDTHQTLRAVKSLQWPFTLLWKVGLLAWVTVFKFPALNVTGCLVFAATVVSIYFPSPFIYLLSYLFFNLRISSYVLLLKYLRPYIFILFFFTKRDKLSLWLQTACVWSIASRQHTVQ